MFAKTKHRNVVDFSRVHGSVVGTSRHVETSDGRPAGLLGSHGRERRQRFRRGQEKDHNGRQRLPGPDPRRAVQVRRRSPVPERRQSALGPAEHHGRGDRRLSPSYPSAVARLAHVAQRQARAGRRERVVFAVAVRFQHRRSVAPGDVERSHVRPESDDGVVGGGVQELRERRPLFQQELLSDPAAPRHHADGRRTRSFLLSVEEDREARRVRQQGTVGKEKVLPAAGHHVLRGRRELRDQSEDDHDDHNQHHHQPGWQLFDLLRSQTVTTDGDRGRARHPGGRLTE